MTRPRRLLYALAGSILATGAPLGLFIVRLLGGSGFELSELRSEIADDTSTYVYVTVSTLVVFALFGYALGRQADALAELARTDALTGLRNQRLFEERLEAEAARAARYGEPLSLLLFDLDGLKAVNDRHGHAAGDAVLRAVADALRQGARQTDLAARVGGDEFALIAPSTDRHAAVALGERIRSLVAGQGGHDATVSVGIACTGRGRQPHAFLREVADTALYEAKRQGRNRVVSV